MKGKLASEHLRARLVRQSIVVVAVSLLVLIPCYWQEFVIAGDLSSHLYNAWLAAQVRSGAVGGVYFAHPFTNVLCDWALEFFLIRLGPTAAEHIVTALAVLVFFWGAFFFAGVAIGRPRWQVAPALAALSYGLVFNLGFLNFYVATGCSLWVMGLLWNYSRVRLMVAAPICILALLAHPMPLLWCLLVLAYVHLSRRFSARLRPALLAVCAAMALATGLLVMRIFPHRWSLNQELGWPGILGFAGADQFFISGLEYSLLVGVMIAVGFVLLFRRADSGGLREDPLVHVWVLQAALFAVTPMALLLAPSQEAFSFIPERVSLFNALIVCMILGRVQIGRAMSAATVLWTALYFGLLFADNRAYNKVQRQVNALAGSVPRGVRVVGAITDSGSRLRPLVHAADRACVGKCFSYGNYEPTSGQFRLRILGPNGAVASSIEVVKEIQEGRHIVTAAESPIYSICDCAGALCIRRLETGEKTCSVEIPASPHFF